MAVELQLAGNLSAQTRTIKMGEDRVLSESEILRRVKAGDRKAYQFIVGKYMKKAYFIALSYVHNHQDALDISQESFVRAYRRMKAYDPARPFFPWLYEILKNLSLDHLKHRQTRHEIPLESASGLTAAPEDREMKAAVWKAIHSLPPDQKEIVLLRYFQQFSYKEIAELTRKPVGTVMSALFCARAKLKEILAETLGFEAEKDKRKGRHGP